MKHLSKIEKEVTDKLKKKLSATTKSYPEEMTHVNFHCLPFLERQTQKSPREYLFISIDNSSRELFAVILPDKTTASTSKFLEQVLEECAYTIEIIYNNNSREFQRNPEQHSFAGLCLQNRIGQEFRRLATPRTNGEPNKLFELS